MQGRELKENFERPDIFETLYQGSQSVDVDETGPVIGKGPFSFPREHDPDLTHRPHSPQRSGPH